MLFASQVADRLSWPRAWKLLRKAFPDNEKTEAKEFLEIRTRDPKQLKQSGKDKDN